MSNRRTAKRLPVPDQREPEDPTVIATGRVRIYRTKAGGVHISARFDGDGADVHAEIPPLRTQAGAMKAAAAVATSTLGKRLMSLLAGAR